MTTITTQEPCRTAFDKQADAKMFTRLHKAVTAMIRYIERQNRWKDVRGAEDRIHTAIVKTLDGQLTWNPEAQELSKHLLGAVWGDIANELKHARRFPQVSLDDESQNLDRLEEQASESIASTREGIDERPALVLAEVTGKLRVLAAGDRGVLSILDAWDQGALTRRDVVRRARMSTRMYDAAYKRLVRLAVPLAANVIETMEWAN
jgi:hypothetical protein